MISVGNLITCKHETRYPEMTREADFPTKVITATAGRAGYRCSIPTCDRITIGPGQKEDQTSSIGTCCHIYSSARNGPRGTGGLTAEQRASASNAFWACQVHGKLIDNNKGGEYPAPLLQSYKAMHEARITREMGGLTTPRGWFGKIEVLTAPHFQNCQAFDLGKVTFIEGSNGSGKTALCEFIAGIGDPSFLWRFLPGKVCDSPLELLLTYYAPEKIEARVHAASDGSVSYFIDGLEVPAQPYPLYIVFLPHFEAENYGEDDDIAFIARVLSIHPSHVLNLLKSTNPIGATGVHNLRVDRDSSGRRLRGDSSGAPPGLTFGTWSGSQRSRVLLSLAIARAEFCSRYAPTLLILDGGIYTLDDSNLTLYIEALNSPDFTFQSILTLNPDRSSLPWTGWTCVQLTESETGTLITQKVIC